MTLGERLKKLREFIGFTIEEVAPALWLTPDELRAIEAGERDVSETELDNFSQLFRQRPEVLLGEAVPFTDDMRKVMEAAEESGVSEHDKDEIRAFLTYLGGMKT